MYYGRIGASSAGLGMLGNLAVVTSQPGELREAYVTPLDNWPIRPRRVWPAWCEIRFPTGGGSCPSYWVRCSEQYSCDADKYRRASYTIESREIHPFEASQLTID